MTTQGPEQFQPAENAAAKGASTNVVKELPQNQEFNDTVLKNRGLDSNASNFLGDVRLSAVSDGRRTAAEQSGTPSERAITTEATNFVGKLREGGPQEAQKLLDNLAKGTAGGDAPVVAREANKALVQAGLHDRYSVSGSSDGNLTLTQKKLVDNSERSVAKLDFYKPGEAQNDSTKSPDSQKMGEVAKRFADQAVSSKNPEQTLRTALDEMKKLGADPIDVARPLNQALHQRGLDMSVGANTLGEVDLTRFKTKDDVIAQAKVPGEAAGTEAPPVRQGARANGEGATTVGAGGRGRVSDGAALNDAGRPADEDVRAAHPTERAAMQQRQPRAENGNEYGNFAAQNVSTGNIQEQIMGALRRMGSGPERARFLQVNGILPPDARASAASGDGQGRQQQRAAGDGTQQRQRTEVQGQRTDVQGQSNDVQGQKPDVQQKPDAQGQTPEERERVARQTELRLGDRAVKKDGATIGISKVNGKDVTTAVMRPDGSTTIYGNQDADGNPRSIQEYKPNAHEPFRTGTRGDNDVWTTRQGDKQMQKQGHLTVVDGVHKFQMADGVTFTRTPDGKASLETSPKPDRVQEKDGSKIEYRNVNGKEVTSAIVYPNGFKAVYGGHDANGSPTSIREYAKDGTQPFRSATLNGDTWKIESPGKQPIELKGKLTVQEGAQTFDTADAKYMRTAGGRERIEPKERTKTSPEPGRVASGEDGSKVEYVKVNGHEVTSTVRFPNGFKAVYGDYNAAGEPGSVKEFAPNQTEPFRTATREGDEWRLKAQNVDVKVKGKLSVKDGVHRFREDNGRTFVRTPDGKEKFEQ